MNTYFTHSIVGFDLIVKVQDGSSTLWIPFDESNRDYQAYLAWVAEGNTPEEWKAE